MELVYLWKHSSDRDMSAHVSTLPVIFRIHFLFPFVINITCRLVKVLCGGGGHKTKSFTLQLHKRNAVVATDGVRLIVRAYFHENVTIVNKKTVKRH
jgi:hypothetical protein